MPYVFDASVNTLVFEADFLAKPVIHIRDDLKQSLSTAPLGFLMRPSDETSVASRIRTALMAERKLALEFPSVAEIATELGMTEQTLRRRLKRESISYRAIKEIIRRDVAVHKLIEDRSSMQEIAFQLGYSEARVFSRAFQQWTGSSPVQYRTKLRTSSGGRRAHGRPERCGDNPRQILSYQPSSRSPRLLQQEAVARKGARKKLARSASGVTRSADDSGG